MSAALQAFGRIGLAQTAASAGDGGPALDTPLRLVVGVGTRLTRTLVAHVLRRAVLHAAALGAAAIGAPGDRVRRGYWVWVAAR